MISIAIVGKGNVAFHLYQEFSKSAKVTVQQFDSRKEHDLRTFDIVIIAVSDDAIAEVSEKIKANFVVHTSGSVHINELRNSTSKGVFYPLQSFSKDKSIDFTQIPFCIETDRSENLSLLESLVEVLHSKSYSISSEERKLIHVAAVFVNNFTNHMYHIAFDLFQKHEIPFEILRPLIKETSEKIEQMTPKEAQTGPAIRNDQETIQKHVNLLSDSAKEVYVQLTESIQHYGKKL